MVWCNDMVRQQQTVTTLSQTAASCHNSQSDSSKLSQISTSLFSDLSKAVQDSVTSASSGSDGESEPALDTETSKPYAGYRRTNSFDRFPFMSRPLRSAGRPGPGAGSSVPQGTGVQSLSNPNVLFCTPQDIRRATLSRY